MGDDVNTRVARHRAHRRGDHTDCLPGTVRSLAGSCVTTWPGLRRAVEAEFADDPARLAVARRHVEQAAERGRSGVAAVAALDRMIESKRAGRSAPVGGAVTIDDEVIAVADEIVRLELARRLDALEAAGAALGWAAAVAGLRAELGGRAGRGRRAGCVVTSARRGVSSGRRVARRSTGGSGRGCSRWPSSTRIGAVGGLRSGGLRPRGCAGPALRGAGVLRTRPNRRRLGWWARPRGWGPRVGVRWRGRGRR
jgi:hypothetical protein